MEKQQTLEAVDEVIEELKNARVEAYQAAAVEAIEKAVNMLEVHKRNIYTLETIAYKVRPTEMNEWGEADAYRSCRDYAERVMKMPEPREYWRHHYNFEDDEEENSSMSESGNTTVKFMKELSQELKSYHYAAYDPKSSAEMKNAARNLLNKYRSLGETVTQLEKGVLREVVDFSVEMDEQSGTVSFTPLYAIES